jgi:hypothetical protein
LCKSNYSLITEFSHSCIHTYSSSFKKWKNIHARHAESISLLDSYLDVKREETARKVFHKWLNAARGARHLKAVLEEKEQEMRLAQLAVAWDQWRGRFKDTRLQPIVSAFSSCKTFIACTDSFLRNVRLCFRPNVTWSSDPSASGYPGQT